MLTYAPLLVAAEIRDVQWVTWTCIMGWPVQVALELPYIFLYFFYLPASLKARAAGAEYLLDAFRDACKKIKNKNK